MKILITFILSLFLSSLAIAAGPTTQAVNTASQTTNNLTSRTVSLAATGDATTIAIPSYVTAYQVTGFKITNCSTTPVLASVGLFTAASAGGTTVVTSATITTANAASVVISSTIASTGRLTSATLFVNVSVANALALTCDFHVVIDDLS